MLRVELSYVVNRVRCDISELFNRSIEMIFRDTEVLFNELFYL